MRFRFLLALLGCVPLRSAQVTLEWNDNSGNEVGFRLERRAGTSAWSSLAILPANAVRHSDPSLPRRGDVAYRVLAFNDRGDSAPSNLLELGSQLYLQESATAIVAAARQYSGRVVILAALAARPGRGLVFEGKTDTAGTFAGTATELVAAGVTPEQFAVSGRFAAGRLVASLRGRTAEVTVDVEAAPASGPQESFSGYHRAPMLGPGQGVLHAIVFPNGQCRLLSVDRTGDLLDQAWVAVAATGQASRNLPLGGTLALGMNPAAGIVSASITGRTGEEAEFTGVFDETVPTARLINLSVRAAAGNGDQVLIAGFAVSSGPAKSLLLRGIGPALGPFGVPGALADPVLSLFSGSTRLATNDDWGTSSASGLAAAAATVGAFPLPNGSRDAALLQNIVPGTYTAHVAGKLATPGAALVEIYDHSGSAASRLVNLSALTRVDAPLIVGFAIQGNAARRLLIRAVGPTLATFGTSGTLPDPTLELFQGSVSVLRNDDWDGPALAAAAAASGAFPLPPGSRDAALLVTLKPGTYSAVVNDRGNGRGLALVEVYDVP